MSTDYAPDLREYLDSFANQADIDDLADYINMWADQVFPDRTDTSLYLKLYGEVAEVIASDGDPSEVADLFILLLDFARRKHIKIAEAIREKMVINESRDWRLTGAGVYQHIKDGEKG